MTPTEINADLANLSDEMTRVELNDWAVNTLREAFPGNDAGELLNGERARVAAAKGDLVHYLRARRPGSRFRLNRSLRRAVFCVFATRMARTGRMV